MEARVDFDTYGAAISAGKNVVSMPQGGETRCPGTRYVAEVKDSGGSAHRLFPFVPTSDVNYQIEAGDEYFRFYRNQQRLSATAVATAISNGTFPSDLTGWTDLSTGTGSIGHNTGGMLVRGGSGGVGWGQQTVTISSADSGKVHILSFRLKGGYGARATVQIGSTSGGYEYVRYEDLGIGRHLIAFTPTGTFYVQFLNPHPNERRFIVDDIGFVASTDSSDAGPDDFELVSPYGEDDLADLKFTQSADVLYIFHPDYRPHKLERRGDTTWSLVEALFEDGPWDEINPGIDLSEQNLVTNPQFENGLVGWTKRLTTNANIEISESTAFLQAVEAVSSKSAIAQQLTTSDPYIEHVLHIQIVGQGHVYFKIGSTETGGEIEGGSSGTELDPGWYTFQFTPDVDTFWIRIDRPTADTLSYTRSPGIRGVFCYNSNARLLEIDGTSGLVDVSVPDDAHEPFRSTDVGRLLRLTWAGREPVWGVITGYTNDRNVELRLFREAPEALATETWQLGAWSDRTGWPSTGVFHQQRLIAAHTTKKPQTIWGSQTGDFENMRPDSWEEGATTVHDDDALDFTLAAAKAAPIRWLIGRRQLVIGTTTGQWAAQSRGAVLTPTDFNVEPQTSIECDSAAPIAIDEVALFINKSRRAIYDIGYSYEIEGFRAADLSILSDHIAKTTGGFKEIAYTAEPYSIVWGLMEDGTLSATTYKREHAVVGATRRTIAGTDAEVISISAIGGGTDSGQVYSSVDRDELWLIVERTINGATKRYIEVLEGFFEGPNRADYDSLSTFQTAMLAAQVDAFYVDCGVTYQGSAATTITGLDHLEGETVTVLADGAVVADQTVSSGSITIPSAATTVHVGLDADYRIRSMKILGGAQTGPGVTKTKNINRLGLVLKDSGTFTYGTEVNGTLNTWTKDFRTAAMDMDEAVPLFTGETEVEIPNGQATDPRIVLKGSGPLPFTLLGWVPDMSTNERL